MNLQSKICKSEQNESVTLSHAIALLLLKWDPRSIMHNNTTIVARSNGMPITMLRTSDTPIPALQNYV